MQKLLAVRNGHATETTCKVLVASLYPGDAIVSCNGVSYPVTMNAIGADRGTPVTFNGASTSTAGYVGGVTITGLSSFTQYGYTASQDSRSASGGFRTAPSAPDDFSLFFINCTQASGANNVEAGFFHNIQQYCEKPEALPVAAILHIDDYDYIGALTTSNMDDSASTGHVATSASGHVTAARTEYDYALGFLGQCGLLGDETKQAQHTWNSEVRQYSVQNLNWLFQWGDWEVYNNIGWDYTTDAYAQAAYPVAKAVYQATWGLINPPLLNTGDRSIPFATTYGPVRVVAVDGVSNGNTIGNASANLPPANPDGMTIHGNDQIDALLTALDTAEPFKIIMAMNSIRALDATSITNSACGAQHAWFDAAPLEYKRFFTRTGATPKSLMDNPKTNGADGQSLVLLGDFHETSVLKNSAAAYAGNAAESFMSVCAGTATGTNGVGIVNAGIREGVTYNGSYIEHLQGNGSYATGKNEYFGVRIDVHGSGAVKEMHVHLLDAADMPLRTLHYVQGGGGNLPAGSGLRLK